MDETRTFYDDLSDQYDLIYEDWWRSVRHQGEALRRLIEATLGPVATTILDCTAGIGTQSLGLALQGYGVLGTDLSERAITRARAEASSRRIRARFEAWDVRDIAALEGGPFDVVLSADNSLPHLIDRTDLERAVAGMWSQTAEPGLVIVTIRDYDALVETKPAAEGPRTLGEHGQRRVVLQLWDWEHDDHVYAVDHLILSEVEGGWRVTSRTCRYRALQRVELEGAFRKAGATDMEWLEPEVSGFFQPLLRVRRGS